MGSQSFFDSLFGGLSLLTFISQKNQVWEKGRVVFGYDAREWRMDSQESWMRYSEYGQTTMYGWEIDHILPNGPDELWNLQPLFWRNNRRKSDNSPSFLDLASLGISRK
jgi:hypothetical protein